MSALTPEAVADLVRPIIGIANRAPEEAFDIMCDRIKGSSLVRRASELEAAAARLLAVFDQQKMTTAERIIVGVSDAGLRTEGNAAIEALRALLQADPLP